MLKVSSKITLIPLVALLATFLSSCTTQVQKVLSLSVDLVKPTYETREETKQVTRTYQEEQLVRTEKFQIPIYSLSEPYFQDRTPGTYRVAVLPFGDYIPQSDDLGAGFSTKFEFELIMREQELRKAAASGVNAVIDKYIEVVGYNELRQKIIEKMKESEKVDTEALNTVEKIINDFKTQVEQWYKRNSENRYEILSRTTLPFLMAEKELTKIIEQAKILKVDGLIDGFVYQNSFIIKVIDTNTSKIVFIDEYKGTDESAIKRAVNDFYYNLVRRGEREVSFAIVKSVEKTQTQNVPVRIISLKETFDKKGETFVQVTRTEDTSSASVGLLLAMLIGAVMSALGMEYKNPLLSLLGFLLFFLYLFVMANTPQKGVKIIYQLYTLQLNYDGTTVYSASFEGAGESLSNIRMNSYVAGYTAKLKSSGKEILYYAKNDVNSAISKLAEHMKSKRADFYKEISAQINKSTKVVYKQSLSDSALILYDKVVEFLQTQKPLPVILLATWKDNTGTHYVVTFTEELINATIIFDNTGELSKIMKTLKDAEIDFVRIMEEVL